MIYYIRGNGKMYIMILIEERFKMIYWDDCDLCWDLYQLKMFS